VHSRREWTGVPLHVGGMAEEARLAGEARLERLASTALAAVADSPPGGHAGDNGAGGDGAHPAAALGLERQPAGYQNSVVAPPHSSEEGDEAVASVAAAEAPRADGQHTTANEGDDRVLPCSATTAPLQELSTGPQDTTSHHGEADVAAADDDELPDEVAGTPSNHSLAGSDSW
jgi:hypothetical protein